MSKQNIWLVVASCSLAIAYLISALTGGLQRAPLTQQILAIALGISIGRVARIWLHN